MAAIPKPKMQTVEAIYRSYEAQERDGDAARFHFGASVAGDECSRRAWYGWRWITKAKHPGRVLRLFETGNLAEARFVADLRTVGVRVFEHDPVASRDAGQDRQWSVRDAAGHFGGSLDGIGIGFAEAPKAWHVLEFKTHNDSSFKSLIKDGVQISKPGHYAQMQTYMHLFNVESVLMESGPINIVKIDRAFYLAVNKNTDELYQERVHYDPAFAIKLQVKANQIIAMPNPPERITKDPNLYVCKMCDHRDTCHGTKLPPRHCRSCMHSTPSDNGNWHCQFHDMIISKKVQLEGCANQRYLPSLVGGAEQIDAADNAEWIDYRTMDGRIWRDAGQRVES